MNTQYFDSPIGLLRIEARSSGITAVTFCDADDESGAAHPSEHTQQCVQELQEYFAGERKVFSCVLSPSGTSFQQHVWQLLQQIHMELLFHTKRRLYVQVMQIVFGQ